MTTWAQQRINAANCHGTVTLDGESLNRDAWAILNVFTLWRPAATIGDDIVITHRDGVLARRRRKTVTKATLEMLVIGDCDPDGMPNVDRNIGLEENWWWLQTNVFEPVVSSTGLQELVLTLPSGATRTGHIHVESAEPGATISGALTVAVEISLPYGRLGSPTTPGS